MQLRVSVAGTQTPRGWLQLAAQALLRGSHEPSDSGPKHTGPAPEFKRSWESGF